MLLCYIFPSKICSLVIEIIMYNFYICFQVRYNKRKKSAGYREAIRQATSEASASSPDLVLAKSVLEESTDIIRA